MTEPALPRTLHFTPDGRHAVVARGGELCIQDLDGVAPVRTLAIPGLSQVAVFDDQVWVVAGQPPVLTRHSLAGRPIEGALPLAPGGRLIAAPFGSPAAVWLGDAPAELRDDLGTLVAMPIAGAPELVIPIQARRWMTCQGDRLPGSGPGLGERRLPARDGAALFEGRSFVLWLAGEPASFVVRSSASGELQQRVELADVTAVRFASRRGHLVAAQGPHRLVFVDLRFGKVLGELAEAACIDDFAIDGDGRNLALALRDADGQRRIVHTTVREVLSAGVVAAPRPAPAAPPPEVELAITDEEPRTELPAPAPPPPRAAIRLPRLHGLMPRPRRQPLPRGEALRVLEAELDLVGSWTLRAIASAWDSRRLGYPNESQHPFELEVAGILGLGGGHAGDHVAAAAQQVTAATAARAADPARTSPGAPLQLLAAELGLSALATDLLLVVAAPALRGELARLYGILANDPSRPVCDELLVERILGAGHEIARELHPHSPLIRYGLVRAAGRARPFAALTVDPIVLARLRSEPGRAAGPATRIRTVRLGLDQMVLPEALRRELGPALARRGPARLVVRGRDGSGRRTLLAALARAARRRLGVIDAALLPREPGELVEALRGELGRALLGGLLPCVANLDQVELTESAGQLRDLFRGFPGPLAFRLSPGARPPLDPGFLCFDLPSLGEGERLEFWRAALAQRGLAVADLATLAARYRVSPGVIAAACDRAAAQAEVGADDATAALEREIGQSLELRLGERATRVSRLATWSSVVLPADVIDSLRELIGRIRHRRTVYETWGFDRTMASSRGLTALFQGAPGTGKTMVAGVIARELGLDLYRIDLSQIMSKWIGETERNLGAVFDAAEDGRAILLFDEADSLFAKRTEVRSSNDRYANLEVNYLLQRLDSFDGIAILTTNSGGSIDPAFKRRLSFRLSFPFPDEDMRAELWRVQLPPELPVTGTLDLGKLARRYQLSGGYIRNSALRAAFLAAQEEVPLAQAHLERAVLLEFQEMGKLATTGAVE